MRVAGEYRGYTVVETDWRTEGGEPIFVVRGLKERPSDPCLTSFQECVSFIDEELSGRAAVDRVMGETWVCCVRANGNASTVTIPAATMRRLDLKVGDPVRVTVSKL